MVTTRSKKQHLLAAAVALSKITARDDEIGRERALAPVWRKNRPRVQKTQPAGFSRITKRSRRQQKGTSRVTVVRGITQSRRTLRSQSVESTASLLPKDGEATQETKKRKVTKYVERETDAARTAKVVIRVGEYRGSAFQPLRVNYKKPYPKGFFSNAVQWKVGYSPFLAWGGPGRKTIRDVFQALQAHHGPGQEHELTLQITKNPLLPGHAYAGDGHKFHALIEPILSCATSNNNQKLASDSLKRNLTYKDRRISDVSPNYHKLLDTSEEELSDIIKQSGRQFSNAKFIRSLFYEIMEENIQARRLTYDEAKRIHEEAAQAEDWIDGLLSLDFMVGMDMQQMFDKLICYQGIAAKTAACIMCFSFGFAIFAVDTHVFRLCQWIGWVPRNCARDDAFKFLTLVTPPELMRDLHQAFWHHGQLCFRCSEKTYHKVNDPRWKATICPLEQFGIDRFPNWEKQADKDSENSSKRVKKEQKSENLNDMTTVWLKDDKEVADAEAAGHEVRETAIDDAFGAQPEVSNIKKELKRSLYITKAEKQTFKEFQKARALAEVAELETKVTRKRKIAVTEDIEVRTITQTVITTGIANQENTEGDIGEEGA